MWDTHATRSLHPSARVQTLINGHTLIWMESGPEPIPVDLNGFDHTMHLSPKVASYVSERVGGHGLLSEMSS